MNRLHPLYIFLIVSLIFSLHSCTNPQKDLPVLRFGHAPHDHHSPLYIAAMNPEYFQKYGGTYLKEIKYQKEYELISANQPIARLLIESTAGGKELVRRLSEQQFDIAFGGVAPILSYIDKGRPIRILSPIMAEGNGLVVNSKLPPDNWQEFLDYTRKSKRPVKIGYKGEFSTQILIFEHALTTADIPFSKNLDHPSAKIILVNLSGVQNLIPAMDNEIIDGFIIMQPYLAIAEVKGNGKTIALLKDMPPTGKWYGHPCCTLAAHNRYTKDHPEITRELATLINRAKEFIIAHPNKSARQVAKWLSISPEIELLSLPTIDFSVKLDDSWNTGVEFWSSVLIQNGKLNGKVREAKQMGQLENLIYDLQLYEKVKRN